MNNYIFNCTLDRVIDGDTVDLNIDLGFDVWIKERIRFVEVDTPEIRTRDKVEKELGLQAKNYLEELLRGQFLYYHSVAYNRDKYGRSLGWLYCSTDGITWINVNREMDRLCQQFTKTGS